VLFNQTFKNAGSQFVVVDCPKSKTGHYAVTEGTVKVVMVNEHGQVYEDQYHTSFNINFHKTMKWVLIIPYLGMCLFLAFVKEIKKLLPS